MVGCRNIVARLPVKVTDGISHSDGGVSEQKTYPRPQAKRWYQSFRWWGVGTDVIKEVIRYAMVSVIPMVGCRNTCFGMSGRRRDGISHSDGGVSEQNTCHQTNALGWYQSFRWWGVGTNHCRNAERHSMVSVIPMVGCRNITGCLSSASDDGISHSDGGVSELIQRADKASRRWYQSFRWWGVGTTGGS